MTKFLICNEDDKCEDVPCVGEKGFCIPPYDPKKPPPAMYQCCDDFYCHWTKDFGGSCEKKPAPCISEKSYCMPEDTE